MIDQNTKNDSMISLQPKIFLLTICMILQFCMSCVSVNVGPKSGEKSTKIAFQEPKFPFKKIEVDGFDHAWRSSKTGNTLAFHSECGASNEPTLHAQETEALSVLNNSKILSSQQITFNAREALESSSKGVLDGIEVQMNLLIFKKNGCSYNLNFVGKQQVFGEELSQYENFKKGFVAP